jgi:dTDP-4-amino-4,6-dideoxygalactose transaminase
LNEKSPDPFIPFAVVDIGEEEIREVSDTLRSGWLTTGPKTRQFELEFAKYLGHDLEALAVNSATAGLHLSLEAAGIGTGDEVITSTYTFTATAEVIRYLGADPVLVDVNPRTLNMDPVLVEAAITPKTKAIIPVHFAGLACEMTPILALAERHNLKVIEDAAHALPATWNGELVGCLRTDATVFSFYATKPLATGEGGMIVTRNPEFAQRCRTMRLHGIDRDAFNRYTSELPSWFYSVVAPGFKYNMTDIAASIGIHQLRKLERFQQRRAELASKYDEAFRGLDIQLPAHAANGDLHAWHLYVIRLGEATPIARDEFINEMAAAGIGTSVHFIPLHLHPYWRDTYNLRPEHFPHATQAYSHAVSLPLYTKLSDSEQDRVIRTVKSILSRKPRRSFTVPNIADESVLRVFS